MKRRNLCKAKKLMTVVLSASMVMGSVVPAMAASIPEDSYGLTVSATNGNTDTGNATDVNVTVNATLEEGSAGGVYAEASDNSKATATVDNDVTATATSENYYVGAEGVHASSNFESSTIVSIGNDVTATSNSSNAYSSTTGISAYSDNESSTKVSVGNDVSATSSDSSIGVNATANGNSKTEVDIGNDLTVSGGNSATGIRAYSGSSGDINDSSEVLVTVDGDVTVKAGPSEYSSSATGVEATANGSSKAEVAIKGGLYVSSESEKSYGSAIGADAYSDASSVSVTVGGDVTADGANTIYANGLGDVDINIGGSVINQNEKGTALALSDRIYNEENSAATLTVTVAKDITAAGDAVTITKTSDKSSIDLVVEGTLSGEHAIVLNPFSDSSTGDEAQSSTANLSITVWKVETTDSSGSLVSDLTYVSDSTPDSKVKYTQNEEAEQNINYILKVDPIATSIGGALSFAGETDSHGFHTAHAGDTVFLELSIPSNYTVDSFYNVDGAADVKVLSSGGKYYIEVPRGGGVFVGVNLKKISGSGSSDSDSSDSSDDPWTVTNSSNSNKGVFSSEAFAGLTFQVMGADGTPIGLNILDVLTPLDPISAFNNFTLGVSNFSLNNVLGAGIVDFKGLLTATLGDTVDVPVAANVTNGKYYTVYFSDGTSATVQCTADGSLVIPFGKNTAGLTYMICEAQTDSLMGLTPIQDIQVHQAGSGVLNPSLENSNER